MTAVDSQQPALDQGRRGLLRQAALGLAMAAGGAAVPAAFGNAHAAPAAAATFGDVASSSGPYRLRMVNASPGADASGLRGELTSTTPGVTAAGIRGIVARTAPNSGYGVLGTHDGGVAGVAGTSIRGRGVVGSSAHGDGVFGNTSSVNTSGVYGQASGGNAAGVYGRNEAGSGVWGYTPVGDVAGIQEHL